MKSLLKKLVSYILQIGADTQDSEYIRLAKRIWCVSLVFSILTCLGISILEFRAGEKFLGAVFFFSLVPFLLALIHGALRPRHFERNAFILQTYLIIVAMVVTLALGGMQKANGATLIGLLGPLFALFFPRKSRAVLLFVLYAALYLGLVFLAIFSWDSISLQSHLADLLFWFGFLSVAGFAFGATYFFVDQRDKVYRLLEKEKERSEEFLRRIKKDLEEAAQIQKNFLPQENPQLEGYEISGLNVPCYEVGGDYFDYVPIDADRLGVVIADVAGKGIGASLLMASLRAALCGWQSRRMGTSA